MADRLIVTRPTRGAFHSLPRDVYGVAAALAPTTEPVVAAAITSIRPQVTAVAASHETVV